MSRNWLRTCSLTASNSTGTGDIGALRVRFQVISHTTQSLGLANIIVTNPSQATVALFQQEFTNITLTAGYEGGDSGAIFTGSVVQSQWGEKENGFTDTLLRIWAADGQGGYNEGMVSTTLAAGATPQDVVNTCLKAMQPYGISMGQVVGVDLSQPKFPRGYVMAGLARDYLREVATSKNATFNLNWGKLNIIAKGASVPGDGIVLNAATGMIGQPIVQQGGIIVRCLINPAIRVDTNVRIDSKSIVNTTFGNTTLLPETGDQQQNFATLGANDGTYRVLHVETEGDTRGPPWLMTLTLLGAFTGQINQAQVGLGYA